VISVKVCLHCEERFDGADWNCPACGRGPSELDDGIFSFTAAVEEESFEASFFDVLESVEEGSFWFRSRNRLVVWALRRFFPDAGRFLEVGCGNGYVLKGISGEMPSVALTGGELFVEGLRIARARMPGVPLLQFDARLVPFDADFDVIGAFDVLEHIEEDDVVLGQLRQALRPGGGLILTVPQHPWLWSAVDEYAHHKRRYARADLVEKVTRAGFEILHTTSFIVALLPILMVSRLWQRRPNAIYDPAADLQLGGLADRTLELVTSAELALTRRGWDWPVGGSILLVGRRPLDS
jgi:SAM-dependent methyltransferase